MKLFEKSATELHKLLVEKQISATEIVKDEFARIESVEKDVQAFLTLTKDLAIEQAQKIDEKIAHGESISDLEGIPLAVKDNICTKGIKTTCASKILENFVPPYNSTAFEKISAMNPILIGKTNMDEFAMGGSTEHSGFHVTKNPWDLNRVPGGSSGGSAAAVASGESVVALGSDTGGSIRQPASFCGVVGIKPTYGRVSRYGLVAYASSLDQIGAFARNVSDVALVLNSISGHDEMDSTSATNSVPDFKESLRNDVKNLKIGLPKEYFTDGIDSEVAETIKSAIEVYKNLGAEIVEISLPHTDFAISTYYLIAPAEAATNLERYDGVSYGARVDGIDVVELMKNTRTEKFGAEVKRRILIGNYALSAGYYDAYYLKALKVRTLIQRDFTEAFEKIDVILAPVSPTPAFKIGELSNDPLKMYLQDIFTVPLNLAGLPGISVPCGFTKSKLPISFQLIGRAFDESTILRAAYTYEQTQNFHDLVAGGAQ